MARKTTAGPTPNQRAIARWENEGGAIPIEPTEALKHLKAMIRAAYGAEDLPAMHKLLKEMERLVEMGMKGPES